MRKESYSLLITLLLSILVVSVSAQLCTGLKPGDWVEYSATYTGNPPDRYPLSSRLEIKTVQGTLITVEINALLLNGTQTTRTETFDLATGAPDFIIIPANLGPGDEISNEELGTYTIERIENYDFKGKTRELVFANVLDVKFKWDRNTGVVIEVIQTIDTFTQTLRGNDTNIIQEQSSDLDPMVIYGLIIAIIAIIMVVIVLLVKRKK